MDLTVGPSNQNSRGLGHWVLDASGATWFLTTNPDFWSHKYASRSLFVTTTAAEKPRSKSLVQRTTDPASRKQALRLRLQTGHRTCRAAGAQPLIYDEHDRATEVQVRDASGEVVSRAVRTYDAQGHVLEEKQILDNPETIFPAETRAQILEQSGLSPDELQQELRSQLTKLMAGQSGPQSVSYGYDSHGRVSHTNRRNFNMHQELETTYNEHGDVESEITRSTGLAGETDPRTPSAGLPTYSEVRYSYKYYHHENWTEQLTSYRSGSDAAFQSSTVTKRILTYY
jgi:hypothetical protein